MRLCVTGSAGFVGSALVRGLEARGDEVVALARQAPASEGKSPLVRWLARDLTRIPDPMEGVGPVDTVVHLAARVHVLREDSDEPLAEFRRVNVEATERLAMAAVAAGARRFVFVSSIGVHGSSLAGPEPVVETSALDPVEPYAQSKLEAEERLRAVARETDLELVIIRPALVVGAGAPGNLARLRSLVARGLPIPVPRRDNRRSFVTLANLVDLLIRCVEHPDAAGQAFVAAEAVWPSTREVLGWIGEGMGRRVTRVPCPAPLLRAGAAILGQRNLYDKVFGDLLVDATKARTVLGWSCRQSLDEAFRELGAHG